MPCNPPQIKWRMRVVLLAEGPLVGSAATESALRRGCAWHSHWSEATREKLRSGSSASDEQAGASKRQ